MQMQPQSVLGSKHLRLQTLERFHLLDDLGRKNCYRGRKKKVLTYTLHRLKLNELISDRKTVTPRYTIIQFLTSVFLINCRSSFASSHGRTHRCLSVLKGDCRRGSKIGGLQKYTDNTNVNYSLITRD